ncbi:extracellular catalytic domain type 1 short-chain-length polyhydroxyalkanoate depolymerase [Methylobacterium aquaticum]|uniref:extracellular catalytic domain type 1 short-chain-length polyhydroxyalkanoate depolymerase n=1 Tax=Methylobacterium aquaticum TaxID=270351 RepID=UPI0019330F6D|nr:PHB depolymerase family esterase [Methylobacterium aquaticum]QRE74305.1 PHB depolymerase family esterase [Methylobacterium aquaticum]
MSAFKNFSPGGPLGANVDMAEVTRLTRAGRLTEAVALLQGHAVPAEPARPPAPSPSERGAGPAIDLEAPTEPGGAWTVPGQAGTPDPSEALRAMPDALKGLQETLQETLRGMPEALKTFRSPGGLADLLRAGGLPDGALDGLAGNLTGNLASHLPAGLGEGLKPRRSVPVPEGARFEERSFSSAAGSRTYKVYVPAGREGQGLPVVVMLHGCTQDPDDFALGTRMNALAEAQGAIVVYPRQERAANAQKCWNWFQPGDQGRGAGEPALIAGIAKAVVEEFGADADRVFVAGLSAGGAAAAILAATYPDVFAAAGIHSGLACGAARDLPSALAAMGQGGAAPKRPGPSVPTIVFHGDADRTVNPLNGERVVAQALPGAALTPTVTRGETPGGIGYTRTVHADAGGRAFVESWVLHGAGHAWSGGSPDGSYTEPRGPDASAAMLRFFLEHRRAG